MPSTSFQDLKLNRQLLNAIDDARYEKPTAIQQKAIPLVLNGHDLMGIAQTGTGKTAAFVLPILMKIKYAQGQNVRALILAPTKELVLQIEEVTKQLASYTDLRILAIYGGIGPKTQIEKMESGIDIIVATPGRFMDIYLRGNIHTKQLKTLVLDEADKMMDMGFMPQIRKILEVIPVKRQNLLFSATMPDRVLALSDEFLKYPERVEVAPQATTIDTIKQVFYEIPNVRTKINFVEYLLQTEKFTRVLVFTKTKLTADNLFKYLDRKKLGPTRVLHSNKGQNTRIHTMQLFKEGELKVLVATDVASRGIDVSDVSHVINFDVPNLYEDYVHRIGRTGRAEKTGVAITFANEAELFHIANIEKLIRKPIPQKKLPKHIKIEESTFDEQQDIARSIDHQKRKEDPTFKGAFHEKKARPDRDSKWNPKNKVKGKKRRR
ncbi:MAG: DEAD/DEAH box helicase [Cyclobacteriaceae bacterium]|nr:DEAD/DEAH box helicase [Cyclobacteriaceae bacterium]